MEFWEVFWCGDQTLVEAFPTLFHLTANKDAWVLDIWEEGRELGSWTSHSSRYFND